MAVQPQFLLGRHHTPIVITRQTEAANGGLSDSVDSYTLSADWKSLEETLQSETIELNSGISTRQNEVVLSFGHSFNISCLCRNDGTDPHKMRTIFLAGTAVKLAWTQGAGASAKAVTAYGRIRTVSLSQQDRGETMISFELGPIDAGSGSYVVA
mgnify:CR=1 FL=1